MIEVLILNETLKVEYTPANKDKHICENLKFYANNKPVSIMYGNEATNYYNYLKTLNYYNYLKTLRG